MFCCGIIIISSRTCFGQQTESLMMRILALMHLRAVIVMIMGIIVIMSMMMMTMLTIDIIKDDTA